MDKHSLNNVGSLDSSPEKPPALLKVSGLTTYLASEAGWVHAIESLSLSIGAGQTYALVGESGCGKSMTALSIARLLPDCGAILAGSVELNADRQTSDLLRIPEASMRRFRGKKVSMIFQEPGTSLNPVMTVGDQLTEVIRLHMGVGQAQALGIAEQWLNKVGLDDAKNRLAQFPFEMSGGQKQRVMIAMALAVKPDLLIADEPTTALDVSIQKQVLDLLEELQRTEGMAMLLITHDLGIVQNMADHVGLMYAGQLVESAPAKAFFAKPSHPYARALIRSLPTSAQRGRALYTLEGRVPSLVNPSIGCRFADRCQWAAEDCRTQIQVLGSTAQAPDHLVRCARLPATLNDSLIVPTHAELAGDRMAPNGAVMQTVGLTVAYPMKGGLFNKQYNTVLHGLDLTLTAGRTVALVGESGSGKTTAARALLGLLGGHARVGGEMLFGSQPLRQLPERGAGGWRAKVQFVFQDPFASLNPRHRVLEILEESLKNLRPDLDAASRKARIFRVFEQVKLPEEALTRFPHEFSGGQRQRIAIARALVSEPQVLICDEPTSALDVSVQAQILNLLKQLQYDTGVAMLFITHNLAVVQYLADEVVVLKAGRVVERAGAQQLFASPKDDYTKKLLAAAPLFQE